MSLQRRLLLYLLLCAPLVWCVALWFSADRARDEVNELFDTELIRLARQVQATLGSMAPPAAAADTADAASAASAATRTVPPSVSNGPADLRDLALAAWDRNGRLLLVDREGVQLPYRREASGFVDLRFGDDPWRVYYLQSADGEWVVAAGQRAHERDELVEGLVGSQLLPWLVVLPVLLLAMAWAVRRSLAPLHALTEELRGRDASALHALVPSHAPVELRPMVDAMNGLFARIEAALDRERRFTADAAHELRTPLAVLRAQWDVLRRAASADERQRAEARLGAGLDRTDRLVGQLLALSRLEATEGLRERQAIDWPAIVTEVFGDVLPLAERRRIELVCEWPADGAAALPLQGDAGLVTILLRNLIDNAVRYAPEGSTVTLSCEVDRLAVINAGPPLAPEVVARLGERFHRAEGQAEGGSGLGISIAARIAALHGLALRHRTGESGEGRHGSEGGEGSKGDEGVIAELLTVKVT